nr:hypothetical protein [Pedobacter panaciterrae]
MQEFDHIQSLWQSHSVEVKISSEEMLSQAKKEVSGIKTRSLLNILGMIISFASLVALLVFYPFTSWTTQAGLSIIIIAIAVSTFILYKDYKIISRSDFTQHPNEFLSQLKIYQLNKFSIYNKLYWFYAAAICLGFILYFYEMLNNLELWFQIGITSFSVFWMALCATFLRKAYLKREKERLDLLIEKFERISSQFKDQA